MRFEPGSEEWVQLMEGTVDRFLLAEGDDVAVQRGHILDYALDHLRLAGVMVEQSGNFAAGLAYSLASMIDDILRDFPEYRPHFLAAVNRRMMLAEFQEQVEFLDGGGRG